MKYKDSLRLINLCVENKIINEKDNKILVYRGKSKNFPEGWYLDDKLFVAQELMNDRNGIEILTEKLKSVGVVFERTKESTIFNLKI